VSGKMGIKERAPCGFVREERLCTGSSDIIIRGAFDKEVVLVRN